MAICHVWNIPHLPLQKKKMTLINAVRYNVAYKKLTAEATFKLAMGSLKNQWYLNYEGV